MSASLCAVRGAARRTFRTRVVIIRHDMANEINPGMMAVPQSRPVVSHITPVKSGTRATAERSCPKRLVPVR